MEAFCTYCSKEKDNIIDLLPAILRYKSKRIRRINEAATLLGYPLFILSGEYGLIDKNTRIPYYDHYLLETEIETLVNGLVIPQIKENQIDKLFFFVNPKDSNITTYLSTIRKARKTTGIAINIVNINIEENEKSRKTGFREIWYSSLKLNQIMVRNNDFTGKVFEDLIQIYPTDGMIYYERGEVFEILNELEKAKYDYEKAICFFPNPKWKNVAYEGLKRIQKVQGNLKRSGELDKKWELFHNVNGFAYIPHEIRVFILSALERYYEEKRLAIGELRICLEMIVARLLILYKVSDKFLFQEIEFTKKIRNLSKARNFNIELSDEILRCWRKMGEIIHPLIQKEIPEIDYEITTDSFIRVIEICNSDRIFQSL